MLNSNYENRYLTPEEIEESVLSKFDDADENHERYHEFCVDSCIGYSPVDKKKLIDVDNAIIVIKYGSDVIYIRVVDGKVVGERPHEFYMVYKPDKFLACAIRQGGKDTYIKIKNNNESSMEYDISVYVMVHYNEGIFTLYFTPDEAKFTENLIIGNDIELATIAKSAKRFFHLPSNFRSFPKTNDESEDDE